MARQPIEKKDASKKKSTVKDAGVKKTTKETKPKKAITDDIDDIFSGKATKSLEKKEQKKLPKKSKKDTKKEESEEEEEEEELSKEQAEKVQEVVFAELAAVKNSKPSTKKRPVPLPSADEDFGDSRGLKKTNRTTEDGYPLYDVKDLNIGNGLDTPDCPFDCNCCK
ncbi:uncharacterized protein B0P05DRAFT_592113 [Gilbertella persicaria]|uniref:uncharacterized protein n=1 Tax=Gilbertella persicaria TaxID=101096 RepID=UPI00221E801D|nr:uncharacterized protein B0P05DRAFT_592113 [Gilbertella persicaria]KAI8049423.1 hypothetical protein B0P05DRAFT_592113 [Gilbertella persicaria]